MKLLILLSALTLLASCTQPPAPNPTPPAPKVMEDAKMMKDETMMKADQMQKDAMMKTDTMKKDMMMSGTDMMKKEAMMKDDSMMMKPTGYMNYDEMKVSEALASGQKVALFFHAPWCPTCKALEKNITTNIATLPADTIIVKVDYDTSTEMKKKYGVTSQHTTVLIDKDMALISKKLGARNITEIFN